VSIRSRITLFGLGVLSGVLVLFSVGVYALLASGTREQQDKALVQRAQQALTGVATAAPADLEPTAARPGLAAVDPRSSNDIFVMVLDAGGAPIVSGGEIDGRAPTVPPEVLHTAAAGQARTTLTPAPGVTLRVHVQPWQRADLNRRGYVVAAQTTRRVDADRVALLVLVAMTKLGVPERTQLKSLRQGALKRAVLGARASRPGP